LASTCNQLLDLCLRGESWSSGLLDRAIAEDEGRALMSIVVEYLGDQFSSRLCDVYARLFSEVIARVSPELIPRTRRAISSSNPWPAAERVYVLSRITLGADVAVTSVLLDKAKRRYPSAEIVFAGPRKNYELFEADPRIVHREVPYARGGSLGDRLDASAALWFDDGLVIDPDSRLTQLGLIRVCPDDRYCFFESRSFGKDGDERLPDLAARWAGDPEARPYVAPRAANGLPSDITVSLGVGENPAKRVSDDFERQLLQMLADTGASVLVDKGGSAEERERVERVIPPGVRIREGAFAPFAAEIARSKLFVGYDSAAGHVASACSVPLISIAKGFASERMAARWRPLGTVIDGNVPGVLDRVRGALATYTFRR
jgi:Glycosyltransferase family 9 (heptosyltransferase)